MKNIITTDAIEQVIDGIKFLRDGIERWCKDNNGMMVYFRREHKDDSDPMYCFFDNFEDDVVITNDGLRLDCTLSDAPITDIIAISKAITENDIEEMI